MIKHSALTLIAAALILTACATSPPPVEIVAAHGSAATLAGKWEGDYFSSDTGRRGLIQFELIAEQDSAFGEVVMIPKGWSQPPRRYYPLDEPMDRYGTVSNTELLTIEFVRVEDRIVTGRLSPYHDPECGCVLFTTFEGQLEGDVIEGTFKSRHSETGRVDSGRWKVTRKQT